MFLWIPGRNGTRSKVTGNFLVNAFHAFHHFNRRYHVKSKNLISLPFGYTLCVEYITRYMYRKDWERYKDMNSNIMEYVRAELNYLKIHRDCKKQYITNVMALKMWGPNPKATPITSANLANLSVL